MSTAYTRIVAGVILVLGAVLTGLGGYLASLGGSWFYLICGLAHLVAGLLVLFRRREGLWLYAAILVGTLAWAIWEAGLDWWSLGARGGLVVILGILLLAPWLQVRAQGWRARGPLAVAVLLCLIVAGLSMARDSRQLHGRLPAPGAAPADLADRAGEDWPAWGGSNHGDRYSRLTQVTPANVDRLEVAWTFRTGDIRGKGDPTETTYELTPLKIGETVYLCTPHDQVIALDARTGKPRWRFKPQTRQAPNLQHLTCRGVAYHADPAAGPAAECPQRIYFSTSDARLFAVDARTGAPCPGFGTGGAVNLRQGMPDPRPGFYYPTSPPTVARNLVIVGGEVTDNYSTFEPAGVIRAYDAVTGRLVWNWDPGRPDDTAPIGPGEVYKASSPNSWSVFSADEDLGMVYIPMGNPTPDVFAGFRPPIYDRFNASIVALDLATGKVRWVFQTVHHDLWDMDIGSQPSLVDLTTPSGVVPAIVAPTKRADIYVLDRRTGTPIFPVIERAAPKGAVQGDHTAPTQPFSAVSFLPEQWEGGVRLPTEPARERELWGVTLIDQALCRIWFRKLNYDGRFTPPSLEGTLVYPGNFGVFNWGSIAVDPVRQVAFMHPNYLAFVSRLIPHGKLNAEGKYPVMKDPAGRDRVLGPSEEHAVNPQYGTPFAADLGPFVSKLGLPCQAPPWGYVAGLDLRTGKVAWMHRNGTVRDNTPLPLPFKLGVPSLGGPLITAGGVGFITGTLDQYIRAYDMTTGEELWSDRLPAGAQANPMTYSAGGRQYVIAVAGGHGSLDTRAGDYIIAYALPAGPRRS
jgi:quinoprotein glucose dehydrogenase